jgi:hypothetical protein
MTVQSATLWQHGFATYVCLGTKVMGLLPGWRMLLAGDGTVEPSLNSLSDLVPLA